MPWTGQSFRKHNSSLSAHQAAKAAKQANAVLKSSGDEGLAIAVANKHAGKSGASRLYKHKGYAEGGEVKDNRPLSDAERKRFKASGIYHGPKITPDTARTIMQNDEDAERDAKDNEREAEKKPEGYAEGGVVRQTEKERDKALGDYVAKRSERRGTTRRSMEDEIDRGVAEQKFKVDDGRDNRTDAEVARDVEEDRQLLAGIKRHQTEIDVDAEAATKRGQRDFGTRLTEKLRPTLNDRKMDIQDPSEDTRDSGEMDTLPRKRDAATESIDDEYPEEIELARGGKITQVAGKPIGKDDGLIAAQKGEFVVRKSAVKKLGLDVLNEINKGRLPSQRLYGRKAARHGA